MSSPKNIQRDCHFVQPLTSGRVVFSTAVAIGSPTANMNSSGSASVDFASEQANQDSTKSIATNSLSCIGVLMNPPDADRVPYRVKARAIAWDVSIRFAIVVGYAPASPSGSDDTIDEVVYLPFPFDGNEFDECLIIEALDSGDGNYGRAVAIGIAAINVGGSTVNDYLVGHISVQNLSVRPPTMAQAIA